MLYLKILNSGLLLFVLYSFSLKPSVSNSNLKQCNAEIRTLKKGKGKTLNRGSVTFDLVIKNTSNSTETYTLYTSYLETDCSNKYNPRPKDSKNSILETRFLDLLPNQSLTLNSGESKTFRIEVLKPKVSSTLHINKWSCIQINAKTDTCNTITNTETIGVYMPNPLHH